MHLHYEYCTQEFTLVYYDDIATITRKRFKKIIVVLALRRFAGEVT